MGKQHALHYLRAFFQSTCIDILNSKQFERNVTVTPLITIDRAPTSPPTCDYSTIAKESLNCGASLKSPTHRDIQQDGTVHTNTRKNLQC